MRSEKGQPIGHSSIYRFLRDLQLIGILTRHDFSVGPARYALTANENHEHMIEVASGRIIEFDSDQLSELLNAVADQHSVRLLRYQLELVVES
jgi:Fur family ferric uptake transcriptional regulator